ncbi:leucine--tRNA ligase [Corynebacterium sp. sy017]|uniref:leucine--tRNA ligase n=1 Tax=unclassified Corynebacterium TaxID=2624378 RepID=UPI00118655FD|nr:MULTISPECIES: leucine--tRNA ligase [unclassified Corynebacterium]MBP3088232.1 leucine--tRNA ligase [Corynebacterium sp. sy017]QDZ43419.1 leucine--tRNA ligase [Corynebacterium sp. sy039]TSD91563.1 leucine--tRNA ligase [Corynebacterium sp. SY003]
MTETKENTATSAAPQCRYTAEIAGEIERKWQKYWIDNGTFNAPNPVGDLAENTGATKQQLAQDKLFVQDMFPYPSGVGLHVGHPLGYIATDVYARFNRMLGKNVLHTLGYDAFGLPAEQYAIQTGTHPRTTTQTNIENMERQLNQLGLGHDRRRKVTTTDPEFYKWTQWIFLQIFNSWFDKQQQKARPISELIPLLESGEMAVPEGFSAPYSELDPVEQRKVVDSFRLVYRSHSTVNWCPGLGTVLANEEVTPDGRSERGNFPVFRKNLSQWMMRITAYSDRLIDDLDDLDWSDKVKSMQRNWIGRSRGAHVRFSALEHDITVFTTRPDTLFGASFLVLAPEHELVDELLAAANTDSAYADCDARWTFGQDNPRAAVAQYRKAIAAKSDVERQENKEKTGVYLGVHAVNPVNGKEIPVFISDYVLLGYGTGAVMAVPAHDQRDYEFAQEFGLPITPVVEGDISQQAFIDDNAHINSANERGLDINGLDKTQAIAKVIDWLVAHDYGEEKIQYKLRDWLFARQRYWGEPFPIVYDEHGLAHALPESMLPIELPEVADYKPVSFDPEDADSEPQPPLAKAEEWVNVELDLGDGLKKYTRDTNVMPQWAGSSWYQLRYIDPHNSEKFCDIDNERYWTGPQPEKYGSNDPGGVDLYVGGVEHAVLHLLYARFWHKVLFDLGFVSSREPYRRLYNQGYIQAYAYTDARGVYVPAAEVEEKDGAFYYQGEQVSQEYGKMGKSLKNAVAPDDICRDFGADTLRVYEMAMGPLDTSRPWATKDVVGAQRFLQRLWRLVVDENTGNTTLIDAELSDQDNKALHRSIAGIRDDYDNLRINTVVAKEIEYVNYLTKTYPHGVPRAAVEPLIIMVAPIAPHIAEELWQRIGHQDTITFQAFPTHEQRWLKDDEIELPVQINGKVRARVMVPADATQEQIAQVALDNESVQAQISGKQLIKSIVVPGRMINFVVK